MNILSTGQIMRQISSYQAEISDELEIRDYYTEKNVFWVPQLARWQTLHDNATWLPAPRSRSKTARPTPTPSAASAG